MAITKSLRATAISTTLSGFPSAALFVFCLALLASNAVALIKAALRAMHGDEEADERSGYSMALEIK